MTEKLEIRCYIDPDPSAIFGRDPENSEGINEKESAARLSAMTQAAIEAAYPGAEVEVYLRPGHRGRSVEVSGKPDEDLALDIEMIGHDVWEAWGWVVMED